jgi:hypothetical protein
MKVVQATGEASLKREHPTPQTILYSTFIFFVSHFCPPGSESSQPKSMRIRIHNTGFKRPKSNVSDHIRIRNSYFMVFLWNRLQAFSPRFIFLFVFFLSFVFSSFLFGIKYLVCRINHFYCLFCLDI